MCMFFFAIFFYCFRLNHMYLVRQASHLFSFRCAFFTTAFVDSSLYYFHFAILAFILFSAHFLQHGSLLRSFHFVVLVFLLFSMPFTHLCCQLFIAFFSFHCYWFLSLQCIFHTSVITGYVFLSFHFIVFISSSFLFVGFFFILLLLFSTHISSMHYFLCSLFQQLRYFVYILCAFLLTFSFFLMHTSYMN